MFSKRVQKFVVLFVCLCFFHCIHLGAVTLAFSEQDQWIDSLEFMAHARGVDSLEIEIFNRLRKEFSSQSFDTLYDQERIRRLIDLQLLYDRMLQENENALLRKSNKINSLNIEKQNIIRNYLLLVLMLSLAFLAMLYYRYRYTNRAKQLLERQKEEIENANRQLMELNAMRDKLFALISHDLRNPFASIVSFSRIMKRDIDQLSKKEVREMVYELDHSVMRINELLENLLQWSRTQTGKLVYNPDYVHIGGVIESSVQMYQPSLRDKDIQIEVKVADQQRVWADQNMTESVLRNLLSNAIKFTSPGGQITISADSLGDFMQICVADNGIGMDEALQSRLLLSENFLSTMGTDEEKGSGLGLFICREFVDRQGGRLWFESERGVGTRFYFSLPLGER